MSVTTLQQKAKQKFNNEIKLKSKKSFQIGEPYEEKWYNSKTQKYKLGKIFHASIQG